MALRNNSGGPSYGAYPAGDSSMPTGMPGAYPQDQPTDAYWQGQQPYQPTQAYQPVQPGGYGYGAASGGYADQQGYYAVQDPYQAPTQQWPAAGPYPGRQQSYGYYGYGGPGGPGAPQPPRKKGKAGLVVAIVLLVVGLALLIGAIVVFTQSQQAYNENAAEYQELADANVTEDVDTGQPVVDFAALQAQNPEIVGWIQIPNTPVNYPVVQHTDNEYYLDHSFLGRYDEFGAVFMDYRSPNDLTGRNTVMYGHHLQNGNMFARVADYSNQADFDTLQNIYYVTADGQVHVLVALCCMVVDGYDVDSIQFSAADQASFEAYVQSLIDRSSARSATATAAGVERIFMLSTCSYERENDRTILVCVDLNGTNGPVLDATQSIGDIQAAANEAAQQAGA